MAPLCKFFQQGNCRNGSNCRFEHPGANNSQNANPFSTNRFGALGSADNSATGNNYKVTKDSIQIDLATELPSWILSSYGPGKDAPEQLFGGPSREQSVEEARLYVMAAANQQQAMSEIQSFHQQAQQQIQTTLGNLDGAVQYVVSAENNHPNRIDICKQNTIQGSPNAFARDNVQKIGSTSAFGSGGGNAFSSTPSQPANPFSTGASSGGGTSMFGQPSALGQKPNPFGSGGTSAPAFGQPSQIGASNTPAFGQPSQPGPSAPAFGQPSQPGSSAPAFGQPSALGSGGPAFGQASTLGQKPNPFGAPAGAPAGPSPFSRQSNNTTTPNPFSQASQAQSNTMGSAFGQPSAIGQKPNPFGAPSTSNASPFGQPAPAQSNPFSQASNNGSADQSMDTSTSNAAANNPFGQPSNNNPSPFGSGANNAFAKPSPFSTAAAPSNGASSTPNAFGRPQPTNAVPTALSAVQPGKNNPYPASSAKQHPSLDSYTTREGGRLTSFRGQPVVYKFRVGDSYEDRPVDSIAANPPAPGVRKPDGTWTRVIFPDGPPPYNPDTEPSDPVQYNDAVKQAYAMVNQTGRFAGDMPEVPPMREDCIWSF